jgi:hypothetical protein
VTSEQTKRRSQSEFGSADGGADEAVLARFPWLTNRRIVFFVLGWMLLFGLISAFISNPFQSEPSATAGPVYWHVMFLHGLLIGMVALGALVACQVFELQSRHVRVWIALGALAATIPVAVGGIFDKGVPGYEVPMWIQIVGFFAFDEILLTLLVGFVLEYRRRAPVSRTLPFIGATIATASLFVAAVMGHLAGWLLEFGLKPGILRSFAKSIGYTKAGDWSAALVGSHSHQMAVASMALIVTLVARQFGYQSLGGAQRRLAQLGLIMVPIGVLAMSYVYVRSGFSTWVPPAWFTSHGGTNGIASDDVITGVFVMFGGLLVLGAFALVAAGKLGSVRRLPVRAAAVWSWILSFTTVAVAGYSIELNTTHFGAGDPHAKGAANDAVFTWLHQDLGLFMLPTLALVMVVVERLVASRHHGPIGRALITGTSIGFIGSVVYVFVDTARHGPGYVITSIGLAIVGATLLATIWWGTIRGDSPRPPQAPGRPPPAHPVPGTST